MTASHEKRIFLVPPPPPNLTTVWGTTLALTVGVAVVVKLVKDIVRLKS